MLQTFAKRCTHAARNGITQAHRSVTMPKSSFACNSILAPRASLPSSSLITSRSRSFTTLPPSSSVSPSSSVDPAEIRKFNAMASEWWDPNGSSAPLHKMNPCRVGFITQQCQTHFQRQEATPGEPLKGLEILDVGCGPGLLSESLARLGGRVHGIDAAAVSIGVARSHASHDPIFARQSGTGHEGGRLTYSNVTAESLLSTTKQYDVVCALEIVEHVTHPPSFINTIGALVKPGGLLIMSTINKTMKSYLLTILGAEYILRMVPVGTHDWNKFISPSALATLIHDSHHPALARFRNFDNQFQPHTPTLPKEATNTWTNEPTHADASSSLSSAPTLGFTVEEVSGMIFNPIATSWYLDSNDVDVNYILVAKRAEQP